MSKTNIEDIVRSFGMSGHMISEDLSRIEIEFEIELGHSPKSGGHARDSYYQQFTRDIRDEAHRMADHFEVFYCLEKNTRSLVSGAMEQQIGQDWWRSGKVPAAITEEVRKRMQRELDSAMTQRSSDPLDFTTFGELGGIITANWEIFGALFSSQRAVERVMSNLNSLRGPIAHCSPLAEDEVLRLRLTLRDWFRLME